jgi:diguanylate cyclase (GGDEF)-like protein
MTMLLYALFQSLASSCQRAAAVTDPEVAVPRHVALHDPLTGLANRRHLHRALTAGVARAERSGQGLGVLFLDLDRFKQINDAHGRDTGDAVLKMCGERFAAALRESGLIAHISGDEFVVLLEHCGEPSAAIAVARKLLDAAAKPILLNGREIAITASIGIALYPLDGADGETLLQHADIALFRVKEQGRNNYQFYSAQTNPRTAQRLAA